MKSQIVTSSGGQEWGGRRTLPYAFTEQGIAMLSSVLKSETAIQVNIQIIRIFIRMREMVAGQKRILLQLDKIEQVINGHHLRLDKQDNDMASVFKVLKELLQPMPQPEPRKRIGFKADT